MNSSSQLTFTKTFNNQNLIVFAAALGVGAYAVYNVGDLQTVIYAVCGAYVLRLMVQNPEILSQLQNQLSALQGNRSQPVAAPPSHSPHAVPHVHPELVPAIQHEQTIPVLSQPRLDMHALQQTGYQPLQPQQQHQQQQQHPHPLLVQQQQRPHVAAHEYDANTPTTPVPGYPQYSSANTVRAPSRAATVSTEYVGRFPAPQSNPFSGYAQLNISNERLSVHSDDRTTPRASISIDPRMSIVSTFSAFPEPTRNPYTSYSHYDAGTIGGERLVQRQDTEYATSFNLSERIAAPPQRPDSQRSIRSETMPMNGSYYVSVQPPSRSSSASIESATRISDYVPKRAHRKPTVAPRVGTVAPPGGGIAPAPSVSPVPTVSPSKSPEPVKFFNSPVVESPMVASPNSGYESDSSHASSSDRSNDRVSSPNGHARTESTASLGLPTYEKHATTIFTLTPKRPGYVPQIQAILKASRQAWLALPGTVSHEVGQDNSTGAVVVVETYETVESMDDFEKSKERGAILDRLKTFIDEPKTTVVRMPGSSAATRIVR